MKQVYVVIELHSDYPKIRGVFEDKAKAEKVAYADTNCWRNVVKVKLNEVM